MSGQAEHNFALDRLTRAELLRYVIRRELLRMNDEQLLAVVNSLGMTRERFDAEVGRFILRQQGKGKRRRMVLDLSAVDEAWITQAIGDYERGGQLRESESDPNGAALTEICLRWMGMTRRGTR